MNRLQNYIQLFRYSFTVQAIFFNFYIQISFSKKYFALSLILHQLQPHSLIATCYRPVAISFFHFQINMVFNLFSINFNLFQSHLKLVICASIFAPDSKCFCVQERLKVLFTTQTAVLNLYLMTFSFIMYLHTEIDLHEHTKQNKPWFTDQRCHASCACAVRNQITGDNSDNSFQHTLQHPRQGHLNKPS